MSVAQVSFFKSYMIIITKYRHINAKTNTMSQTGLTQILYCEKQTSVLGLILCIKLQIFFNKMCSLACDYDSSCEWKRRTVCRHLVHLMKIPVFSSVESVTALLVMRQLSREGLQRRQITFQTDPQYQPLLCPFYYSSSFSVLVSK